MTSGCRLTTKGDNHSLLGLLKIPLYPLYPPLSYANPPNPPIKFQICVNPSTTVANRKTVTTPIVLLKHKVIHLDQLP